MEAEELTKNRLELIQVFHKARCEGKPVCHTVMGNLYRNEHCPTRLLICCTITAMLGMFLPVLINNLYLSNRIN